MQSNPQLTNPNTSAINHTLKITSHTDIQAITNTLQRTQPKHTHLPTLEKQPLSRLMQRAHQNYAKTLPQQSSQVIKLKCIVPNFKEAIKPTHNIELFHINSKSNVS